MPERTHSSPPPPSKFVDTSWSHWQFLPKPQEPDFLPAEWLGVLDEEFRKPYFKELIEFVRKEYENHTCYPPDNEVFNAFHCTPFSEMKVLLLGQDPYPNPDQAHGLCFSVRPGVKAPRSLMNIFKELHDDLGCTIPNNGCLTPWAKQGVLMLNAVLTVRAGEPNSHKGRGWEQFTDAVIQAANDRAEPMVFLLWGNYAQKKGKHIDENKHCVIKAAHPSPLSAKGFFGSRPFSKANQALREFGHEEINWQIPNI